MRRSIGISGVCELIQERLMMRQQRQFSIAKVAASEVVRDERFRFV